MSPHPGENATFSLEFRAPQLSCQSVNYNDEVVLDFDSSLGYNDKFVGKMFESIPGRRTSIENLTFTIHNDPKTYKFYRQNKSKNEITHLNFKIFKFP